MKRSKRIGDILTIIFSAVLLSLSYHIFVFPNQFAPSGIPGVATIVQEVFGFQAGYLTMIVNIPLLIIVYFAVNKEFAINSAIYTVIFSALLVLFEKVDLSAFVYHTDTGTSTILAPLVGSVLSGFSYSTVMRRNGSTGGIDLIGAWIHHRKPEMNMMWIIFSMNAVVAVASYFVYDYQMEPVILCLMYSFVTSHVCDTMLKGLKEAVKFEIITDRPEELSKALMECMQHGVTRLPAVGGFTNSNKTLLICVVNKRQIVRFQRVLEQFPGSFAYLSGVKETMGNFRKVK